MSDYYRSFFHLVGDFNTKFDLPTAYGYYNTEVPTNFELRRFPQFLTIDEHHFRRKFMAEELEEFDAACAAGDLPKAADALVDLVYVALGTAHFMGLPFDELFAEVQRANLTKERTSDPSKLSAHARGRDGRGGRQDIVKPEGWEGPKIAEVLEKAGWKNPDKEPTA